MNELLDKLNNGMKTLCGVLETLKLTIKEIVLKNGGYVDMSDDSIDCAFAVECCTEHLEETRITGLRVNEQGVLEYRTELNEEEWRDLQYSENYYVPTLVSIAENLTGYVEIEDNRTEMPWDYGKHFD